MGAPLIIGIILILDVLIAILSYYAGHLVRFGMSYSLFDHWYATVQIIFYVITVLLSAYFCELYNPSHVSSRIELAARIAVSNTIAFFVLASYYYLAPDYSLGRGVFSLSLIFFGILHYSRQRVFRFTQNLSRFSKKIIILGTGTLAEEIKSIISCSHKNLVFVGYIKHEQYEPTIASKDIIGSSRNFEEIISGKKVDQIVVALSERRGALPVRELLTSKLKGIEIFDAPSFYEELTGKLLLEDLHPSWFIYSKGFKITPFKKAWKRALDIILSFVGILFVLPFIPIIITLIKSSSEGPILFKQKRVGAGGNEFTLLKFRTMSENAEKETGPVWASENDPRITWPGRWFRKVRIDEIPQLVNILKGEMSLIGPRPERKEFVDKLTEIIPYYNERHSIKPGLTGWAQINYPYGATDKDAFEKLRYDLYYIKHYNMILDLIITLDTIKVVLFGKGGR